MTAQRVQPALLPTSIGVLAVCGLLIEGLITDWSALLITRDFGGPESWGAVGLTIFSVAMFISRSSGDVAIARLGEWRLLVLSAASIVTAILLSIGTGDPLVMVLGIGIIGLVLGPLFPLAIARASRVAPGQEATMTARVSAVGYLAYLLGPPMIGAIADALGLPTTLGLIVCLACAGIVAARASTSTW
ncbi:hypothetical protein WG915_07365 [Corynebacterium sp. H128]|uniref:hypothetical protein n=1 Tax=unclassified Corynebacterium TaxID=2624378 RepID=UPI0030B49A73